MMILSIIIVTFSFIIQSIISNYIGYTYSDLSLFSTLYVLISLLIIRPYFENKKKYLTILIIFGIIIDIVYTNTFILNTCLFIILYYFNKAFYFLFPYNLFTINISNLLSIYIYHIISFLFLAILKYDNYTFSVLIKILTNSIMMTIIYTSIIYITTEAIKEKLDLKEVK